MSSLYLKKLGWIGNKKGEPSERHCSEGSPFPIMGLDVPHMSLL